jgi:Uma2 family endonuclease
MSVIRVSTVNYPESDGKPMGETDLHRDAMVRNIELLKYHYRGQRVYVSGDLLVYYEEGNPKKYVVPDASVVKGIDPGPRRIYRIWIEGKAPDVVIETTSRKTKRVDTQTKPQLYARLGIREYFMLDLEGDYLDPRLQGYRMQGGQYAPIDVDDEGFLFSRELELRLKIEQGELQFYRRDTGERLLTAQEQRDHIARALESEAAAHQYEVAARQAEVAARQVAEAAARRAEADVERLREELRKGQS